MSTYDVPGYVSSNKDVLAPGCWAKAEDGTLIHVDAIESEQVVYSVFDMNKRPIMEYRDSMDIEDFKKYYSWKDFSKSYKRSGIKWLWKDKTPFPWDCVLNNANVVDKESLAEQLAENRGLICKPIDTEARRSFLETIGKKGKVIIDKIQRAIDQLKN